MVGIGFAYSLPLVTSSDALPSERRTSPSVPLRPPRPRFLKEASPLAGFFPSFGRTHDLLSFFQKGRPSLPSESARGEASRRKRNKFRKRGTERDGGIPGLLRFS